MLIVAGLPPLILYVTVTGNDVTLVKVTVGAVLPWHANVVPLTVAMGIGFTVTVTVNIEPVQLPAVAVTL